MHFDKFPDHITSVSSKIERRGIKAESFERLFYNAELLEEQFDERKHIDQGKSGEIWIASSPSISQGVCMKTIHTEGKSANTLEKEYEMQSLFYDAGVRVPMPFAFSRWWKEDGMFNEHLAMEFLQGQNLSDFLSDLLSHKQGITGRDWLRVTEDLRTQIDVANRAGLYHRDLDPKNVFLRGMEKQVYLIDFGDSKRTSSQDEHEIYETAGRNFSRDNSVIQHINRLVLKAKVLS